MSEIEMYNILENILKSILINDENKVQELNKDYENLTIIKYHTPLEAEYDGCRISFVLSLTMPNKDEYISDGKKRFYNIPKP